MVYSNNLFYTNVRFFYLNYYFNTKFVHLNQLLWIYFPLNTFLLLIWVKCTDLRQVQGPALTWNKKIHARFGWRGWWSMTMTSKLPYRFWNSVSVVGYEFGKCVILLKLPTIDEKQWLFYKLAIATTTLSKMG